MSEADTVKNGTKKASTINPVFFRNYLDAFSYVCLFFIIFLLLFRSLIRYNQLLLSHHMQPDHLIRVLLLIFNLNFAIFILHISPFRSVLYTIVYTFVKRFLNKKHCYFQQCLSLSASRYLPLAIYTYFACNTSLK